MIRRTFLPTKEEWIANVQKALSKNIEKVVLARCEILDLSESPDPFALTAQLKKKAFGSYVFCFSDEITSFLGATPERLFKKEQNILYSEAMAGTRPAAALKQELLSSPKDLRELRPIQIFLTHSLSPICAQAPVFSPITIHATQNVQHLYSQCRAMLLPNIEDQEILDRIHPTPALCGTPSDQACDLIRQLEPFERGLYGGALGWRWENTSEWIVGIRSCLIRKNKAYLYAGAGIVDGSKAEEEWEELNQKSKVFESLFKDSR
ncbi:MAG TPA: isochorismate synthase [Chlamydiales bacterium]|nr:isochorismate synthase [Chlamydiales bacterium]